MAKAKNQRASWFRMRAASRVGKISILGDIGGYGVSAEDFINSLDAMGPVDRIELQINSDGGDVHSGFAIYNALQLHPAPKAVTIMGLAASMASVVAMAGDTRSMPKNAMLMIHNPVGQIAGESDEIAAFAEAVAEMRDSIATAYVDASGQSKAKMLSLMDKQSWIGAAQAKQLGLITEITEPIQIAARFDISRFTNAPRSYGAIPKKENTMSKATKDDDFEGNELDSKAVAEIRRTERESIRKLHADIGALCRIAGRPEMADKFIDDDLDVAAVVAELDKLSQEDAAKGKAKPNANAGRTNTRTSATAGRGDELNNHTRVQDDADREPLIDQNKIWDRWNSAGTEKRRAH